MDWQPEKRIPSYRLEDKNAVLIRGWKVSCEENIDTSAAEVIPVNWPTKTQQITKGMAENLGASDVVKIHADRETTILNSQDLNNLVWTFMGRSQNSTLIEILGLHCPMWVMFGVEVY